MRDQVEERQTRRPPEEEGRYGEIGGLDTLV